jgi:tetratricopeptide (TPR) repeat protein
MNDPAGGLDPDQVVELINGARDLIAGDHHDEAADDLRTALPSARRMFAEDPAGCRLVIVFALVGLVQALRDGNTGERAAALREIDATTSGYEEDEVLRGVPGELRPYRLRSLRRLATLLRDTGDVDGALEAATAARDEALLIEPGRHGLDLDEEAAISEGLLISVLVRAGRTSEALEAGERLVGYEETLTARDSVQGQLGDACLDHGLRLLSAGRTEEGVAYLRRAVEAYRVQVEAQGDVVRFNLALAADRLGVTLARGGDPEEGLSFMREAVDAQRAMESPGPQEIEALAGGLRNMAVCLGSLDRDDDAVETGWESLEQFRRLAELDSQWVDEVVSGERLQAEFLAAAGRLDEALELGERSIAEEEARLAKDPRRSRMQLAESRVRQGLRLDRMGREDEAAGHLRGAVEIYRQAVAAGPGDVLYDDFARTAGRQATSLEGVADRYRGRDAERLAEVLEVLEKAHALDGDEDGAARVRSERLTSAQA